MVQIIVAEVTPQEAGKKTRKVKDTSGKQYTVWSDKAHLYRVGSAYEVDPVTKSYNGRTYMAIDEEPLPVQGSTYGAGAPVPQTSGIYAAEQSVKQRSYVGFDEDKRRMDIFICGAFNNIMSNPNINPSLLSPDQMVAVIEGLKAAWSRTLG